MFEQRDMSAGPQGNDLANLNGGGSWPEEFDWAIYSRAA